MVTKTARPTQRRATAAKAAPKKAVVTKTARPTQRPAAAAKAAPKKAVVTKTARPTAGKRPAAAAKAAPKKAVAAAKPTQRPPATDVVERNGRRRPVVHALGAAERAVQRNSLQVRLPIVGEVQLPALDEFAYIGGVTVLAIVGVVEWPVAVLLGLGHGLAGLRHRKLLRAFGQALEEV